MTIDQGQNTEPPDKSKQDELLGMQLDYSWKWFQYHADQRLKAFNYFILLLGAMLVAYGTAMKEFDVAANNMPQSQSQTSKPPSTSSGQTTSGRARSYSYFAAAVAICGFVISIAFFCMDVRNVELVECGRASLDKLEQDMKMDIRRDDRDRVHLGHALRFWNTKSGSGPIAKQNPPKSGDKSDRRSRKWWDDVFIHKFWIRVIYFLSASGFIWAAIWSWNGFQ